jgi:proteasome lid subunit RPN8/RPN11
LSILGVYHSHPAGVAEPSPTDIDEAMYPEWAYVIIGLEPRRTSVRAFRIRTGAVLELRIEWRT